MNESEFLLSPEERKLLEPTVKALSDRAKIKLSVELLVFKWSSFVQRVEVGYDDSIYEYVNDLTSRTLLQRILSHAPEPIHTRLANHLAEMDERFRSASRAIHKPVQKTTPESLWWFYRVPLKLSDELQTDLLAEGID